MSRRILIGLTALIGTIAIHEVGPNAARAAFDPGAEIVSVDNASGEQGDAGVLAATMTHDGRYVVFQTQAHNFFGTGDPPNPPGTTWGGGIFRYDRLTGATALVADGDLIKDADGSVLIRGASNPSVSDDGRHIVFSTAQQLVPGDRNSNVDVYVRDMSKAISDPGAYTLASAKDASDTPASYARPQDDPAPALSGQRNPGSEVWPKTSISANGQYVVFRTVEWNSDLPDLSQPPSATTGTPPGQVFVRDLANHRTSLLTQTSQAGAGPPLGSPTGGAGGPLVISGDGSTVAWLGGNAPAQTAFLSGESGDPGQRYYLLRRWQGAGAKTIRITGIADPADPFCPSYGSVSTSFSATGPCDGPLTGVEAGVNNYTLPAPALSADGQKIAYIATGELRPPQTSYLNPGFDLFYVDLGSGAYRSGGLRASTLELTHAGNSTDSRATPPIDSVTMTPDGRYLGITTGRVVFADPALSSLGTFRATTGVEEAYVVDIGARTVERVVTGAGGGDSSGSVLGSLSLSADAGLAAFVSAADNLIFGDANGAADAFVAHRTPVSLPPPPPGGGGQTGGGFSIFTPPTLPSTPSWVSVRRQRNGTVLLGVRVPGPGQVVALARRRGKGAPVVARGSGTAQRGGVFRLRLGLLPRYASLIRRHVKSISATLSVTWSPKPPQVPKKALLGVTFLRPAPHHPAHRRRRR